MAHYLVQQCRLQFRSNKVSNGATQNSKHYEAILFVATYLAFFLIYFLPISFVWKSLLKYCTLRAIWLIHLRSFNAKTLLYASRFSDHNVTNSIAKHCFSFDSLQKSHLNSCTCDFFQSVFKTHE